MNYMFQPGFLGTRAPFFMDFFVIIVALLPLFVAIAISFAKKRNYHSHAFTHTVLFILAVIVIAYFEYGIRMSGGYEGFAKDSSVSYNYIVYVLIFHIIVAIIGFFVWGHTLISARKDSKKRTLPGLYSPSHKKAGKRAFLWIVFTSVTGIWVYIVLFMV